MHPDVQAARAASGSSHRLATTPSTPAHITGKRPGSQSDPAHGAQKRQRRTGNLAEGESQILMSSQTRDNPATSPDIGTGPNDDVVEGSSPRGTFGSPAHRATWAEAGRLTASYHGLSQTVDDLSQEVQQLCDRVDQIGSPSSVENRLRTLENGFSRLEGQLDILMRMQQYVARPPSAQAPPSLLGKDPDTA